MTHPGYRSDLDIFADETLLNPYPIYSELRETAPAVWLERNNCWAITRYNDIREALRNTDVFSSEKVAFNDAMNTALIGTSLATDPPHHMQLRKTILAPLVPRALNSIKEDTDQKAEQLINSLVSRGSFDAIRDLARAFPMSVVTHMLGVHAVDGDRLLRWGDAAFNTLGPMNERTMQDFPVAKELFDFCATVKAEDLREGSLGRGIFEAADRGEIARESCGPIIHQYIAAGLESTITAIGNTISHWASNPEQYARVVADPSLVPAAFNESLRYEAPLNLVGRLARQDFTIEGITIPAGSQVAVILAAGNRDPRKYENPDQYIVERNPVDHLSFGVGTHSCAGQNLAKIEAHAILAAFVSRIKSFETDRPVQKLTNMTRGLESLIVTSVVTA